ncbi:MAG: preprotein translocase subunit SecE [Clostridia bacterium]|nr:preprotein translocase subunit SecE [Clostridia bacterium]
MAKGFVKGVKSELKKVVWPTKEQLIKSTTMVILLVVVFSVIILGFDMLLEFGDTYLWNFIQQKVG